MQWLRLAVVLVGLALAGPTVAKADNRGLGCDMPGDLLTPPDPLPHVAAALAHDHLNVLALGSGSTVGESGGSNGPALAFHAPGASYPYRMAAALAKLRPEVKMELIVKGGRGLAADDMLPILRETLATSHFDLILWQTGTVEAVRGSRPDLLRANLEDGASAAAGTNADLVLVDPQFSRFLRANADLMPYETVLRQVAAMDGVTLFPRFDLTQDWVDAGQIDVERVPRAARDRTIALLNDCLGEALARFILAGAAEH